MACVGHIRQERARNDQTYGLKTATTDLTNRVTNNETAITNL